MIFYHMELAKVDKINNFLPRIPYYIMDMEDTTIPRICVSNTIEGCLSAAPWGGLTLDAHPLGTLYRVYVFQTDNYIKPEILAHKYGVLDAIINKEYWLLDEIKPIDDFLIDIKEYTYGSGIMVNGKEHTIIENLKYEIVNNNQVGNVVNLKDYKEKKYYYEIIELIIESYFLQYGEFIEDFMDNVTFQKNNMYINDEMLFFKDLFYNIINDNNEMDLFRNIFKAREQNTLKIS